MAGLIQRVKRKIILEDAVNDANEDLMPTPFEVRTWRWWNYSALWAGQSFDATWWSTGASFISTGLTVKQTIAPVLIGTMLLGFAAVLNATFGAHYHIGFPAMIRPTFGITGSKIFVGMRGMVGVIWYAIQVFYAAQLMNIMFIAMFGFKYKDWNPAVPESAGTDAKTMMCYFLAWSVALPLAFVHPSKLRLIFSTRVSLGSIALFAMFMWCTVLGQNDPTGFKGFDILQPKPVSGASLGWATMSAINSVLATTAPMITNQSDVSRYAKNPEQAGWPQGFAMFITKTIVAFFSIVATASLQSRFGDDAKWNIWEQLELLMAEDWTAKTRFGCFMIAFGVFYSVLVTNAYCNTVPFGADIAAIWPRYFNIVRGQIFIAFISMPILPWQILVNAQAFLTFLGSYTFLMGALLGCQWGDFMFRKGNYHVPSMYDYSTECIYMYTKGYNWRGFVAWFVAFCVIFPGLVAAYIPDKMSIAAQRIYSMGWIISVPLSMLCYILFSKLFPVPMFPSDHKDCPEGKKWLGMSPLHGIFPDESVNGRSSYNNSTHAWSMVDDDEKMKDFGILYASSVNA